MKRRLPRPVLLTLLALLLLPAAASAGPGGLDRGFGVKGIAFAPSGVPSKSPWTDAAASAARSADGTTFVFRHAGLSEIGGRIVAFTAGGELDREFGQGGEEAVATSLDGQIFEAQAIAADPAGRLLISGKVGEAGVGVVRLLPSGLPDPSFGALGHVVRPAGTDTGEPHAELALSSTVSVDPSGRVLVVASTRVAACPRGVDLVRLGEGGEPDKSFGQEGTVHLDAAIQAFTSPQWVGSDGSFEVAIRTGSGIGCKDPDRSPERTALMRFDAAGNPNPGFGSGGTTDLGSTLVWAIATDGQGRTVVLYYGLTLRRVSPTGSFEASYGGSGKARLESQFRRPYLGGLDLREVAVTAGGGALVAGTRYQVTIKGSHYGEGAVLLRLDPEGRPTRGFGERGLAVEQPGKGGEAHGEALLLDPAGHALLAGLLTSPRNPKVPHGVGLFAFDLTH